MLFVYIRNSRCEKRRAKLNFDFAFILEQTTSNRPLACRRCQAKGPTCRQWGYPPRSVLNPQNPRQQNHLPQTRLRKLLSTLSHRQNLGRTTGQRELLREVETRECAVEASLEAEDADLASGDMGMVEDSVGDVVVVEAEGEVAMVARHSR